MLGTIGSGNTGGTSTAVMFEPGRILQVGGGGTPASRNANLVDINSGTPMLTALPQAQFGRHWGNATVMADGRVLVSGGSAENNAANGVAYTSEIFNPATRSWSTGATATRMRLYHSASLLLPDATVITMGGGTPGPETNLNAEIYYPPYLFNDDGTAASRPTITAATSVTDPGRTLSITTPDAAGISTVSLVKTGSVTHSDDMDQRFINLTFSRSGDTLTANLPTNVNETPPGHYMIFVFDAAGVPSPAAIVRINVAGTTPPPPTTTTTTTLPPTTTTTTTTTPPTTTTTTTPPTTTTSTTSTTSTTTTTSTSTTTTTRVPPPAPTNLVVNGGFERPSEQADPVPSWRNTAGPIDVFRNVAGLTAAEGTSIIEIDSSTAKDRIEQAVATTAGRTYVLSFAHSPRPGISNPSNKFDVYWNNTKLVTLNRSGNGLSAPSWQTATFTVTGTGNDRISFRESDNDNLGTLLDDVRLI